MIRWKADQLDMWTFIYRIEDEYNRTIYSESTISAPAFSILIEILTDYQFAKQINSTNKIFNYDSLSSEDRMDLRLLSIHKLEDADNEGE